MVTCSFIPGGVAAAKGFTAAGVHCGIRKNKSKRDLALISADCLCNAAAVYTQNLVCGAPVTVTKQNLADGKARAVVCNSGIANTCNADGVEKARGMCEITAKALGIAPTDVIVASTGVIGQPLDLSPVEQGMPQLIGELSKAGSDHAAQAIMTTDTHEKEIAVEVMLGGVPVTIGGMCKGSGMIHPNMCTMLSFVTTDAAIAQPLLLEALQADVCDTYNMISVDGDTSTNDTCLLLANGMAENPVISEKNEDYDRFCEALRTVNEYLAKQMAGDGEGATALFEVKVIGAETKEQAKIISKSVITSNLTKAAIYGHDANWGRILCAMGYSGAQFDPEKVDLFFESAAGKMQIIKDGVALDYSEEEATKILSEPEVTAIADIKMGTAEATAWGCDLTYDYVKINADYRS